VSDAGSNDGNDAAYPNDLGQQINQEGRDDLKEHMKRDAFHATGAQESDAPVTDEHHNDSQSQATYELQQENTLL
jgi:hypothetical protein